MRVVVARHLCQGHARCAAVAPSLFQLDADGYLAADGFEAPPEAATDARRGARACPERAISIDEAVASRADDAI